jgi:hypothetical protein
MLLTGQTDESKDMRRPMLNQPYAQWAWGQQSDTRGIGQYRKIP